MVRSTLLIFSIISEKSSLESAPLALCFYLLRGHVKHYYMFLFDLLASTFGAQRRKANLSYTAPLFALVCCADIHAVIFWLQPTEKQVLRFVGTSLSLFAFAACAGRLLLLEVFISLSRVTQN